MKFEQAQLVAANPTGFSRANLACALEAYRQELARYAATVTTGGPPKPSDDTWANVTIAPPDSASDPNAPALRRSLS